MMVVVKFEVVDEDRETDDVLVVVYVETMGMVDWEVVVVETDEVVVSNDSSAEVKGSAVVVAMAEIVKEELCVKMDELVEETTDEKGGSVLVV